MEEIKNGIYFLGVVHANALTAVWYFILTNVYIAVTFVCMLYVFNMQNLIAEHEFIRPVRRMSEVEGYREEEGHLNGLTSDIVMLSISKERAKLLGVYGVNILLLILCLLFESRIQLFALMMMWIVGAFSVWRLEGDRKEMCDRIEAHSFGFVFATLTLKFLISQLMGSSTSDISRALGVALPATTMYSISNYVPMLFMIFTIMIPANYFRIIWQRYTITKNNRDIDTRRGEVMRTGNQNFPPPSNYPNNFPPI